MEDAEEADDEGEYWDEWLKDAVNNNKARSWARLAFHEINGNLTKHDNKVILCSYDPIYSRYN